MVEKYEFEEFIRWSYPKDIIVVDDETFLNEISSEMKCMLHDCSKISEKSIIDYFGKLPKTRRDSIIHLFRLLTGTAKTNFEIFFVDWILKKIPDSKIDIMKSNRKHPFSIRIQCKGHELATKFFTKENYLTTKFIDFLDDSEIQKELILFFADRGLIKKIDSIKQEPELGSEFIKYLVRFDSRGSDAAKRGKVAEDIIRKKISEFGLEENIDFNSTDWDTKEVLTIRLEEEKKSNSSKKTEIESKINKIKKEKFERALDIVLIKTFPSVLIQSTFYGSDVASIADATVNELSAENELVKIANKVIDKNKIKFIGLIDGPGWAYSISFGRLKRVLEQVDDYFGLRTATTKLRKIMHDVEQTFPIDFEVGIMLNGGSVEEKALFKSVSEMYGISEVVLKSEFEKWKDKEKFIIENKNIKLKSDREDFVKKILILDILFLKIKSDKSGEIVVPQKEPIKIQDVKTTISDYNLKSSINLEKVLTELQQDGEIIRMVK